MCTIDFQFGRLIPQSVAATALVTRYHQSHGDGEAGRGEEQPVNAIRVITSISDWGEDGDGCRRREGDTGEKEPGRSREDGGRNEGVVGAMDQSFAIQQARQTLFDQLPAMQLLRSTAKRRPQDECDLLRRAVDEI